MHVALLNALDLRLRGAQIVVTGANAEALVHAALVQPFIERMILRAESADALPPRHPARAKIAATSVAAAFICIGETCSLPITDPAAIAKAVNATRG